MSRTVPAIGVTLLALVTAVACDTESARRRRFFDGIQESARHKSGYAMRFPRIARIREDKTVDEISTLDDVRRIYEGQLIREKS